MLGLRHASGFLDPTVGLLDVFADDQAGAVARVPGGSRVDVRAAMRVDVLRHMRGHIELARRRHKCRRAILAALALHAGPGLEQRLINREMLNRQQDLDSRQMQATPQP